MKFTNTGYSSSQHGVVESNVSSLHPADKTHMTYDKKWKIFIKEAKETDIDKRPQLEVIWFYTIYHKSHAVFDFNATQNFYITEIDKEPDTEDLKKVVTKTFNNLQEAFDQRRSDYKIFDTISDISPETIERLVPQLKEELLLQLTK